MNRPHRLYEVYIFDRDSAVYLDDSLLPPAEVAVIVGPSLLQILWRVFIG
jgi:hypothetical protein